MCTFCVPAGGQNESIADFQARQSSPPPLLVWDTPRPSDQCCVGGYGADDQLD
jgi:hypothetical protein